MASVFGAVAAIALSASGHGDAAIGAVIGSGDQTQRIILKQSRQDESEADEWAIRLMQEQGYSLRPMANLMARLSKQRLLPQSRQSKYYQTHPGARERSVVFLNHALSDPASNTQPPPDMNARFQHIKAKLEAWTVPPEQTLVNIVNTNPDQAEDLFQLAIASYRLSDLDQALMLTDQLITANPDQPFYWEFKGEILLSAGRAEEAADAFEASLERLDDGVNRGQILLSLGRALMTKGDQDSLNSAIPILEEANQLEPEWAFVKHQLGITYGRAGRVTDADLILAERAIMLGNHALAKQLAQRARDREDASPIQRQLALDLIIEADQ
jgi:predicted Zn-dependent protease